MRSFFTTKPNLSLNKAMLCIQCGQYTKSFSNPMIGRIRKFTVDKNDFNKTVKEKRPGLTKKSQATWCFGDLSENRSAKLRNSVISTILSGASIYLLFSRCQMFRGKYNSKMKQTSAKSCLSLSLLKKSHLYINEIHK